MLRRRLGSCEVVSLSSNVWQNSLRFSSASKPEPKPRAQWPREILSWEKRLGGSAYRFPEWLDKWNVSVFYKVGTIGAIGTGFAFIGLGPTSLLPWTLAAPLCAYWLIGLEDLRQGRHAVRKNFPVLGRIRYLFESVRPEIRQYFVESDSEAVPFSRESRSIAYARAKAMPDTTPFGTRKDVNEVGYEWIAHSMWPKVVPQKNFRITIGGPDCDQPYSASLLNISGMSFGALSKNAILALNGGAKAGHFYHNTGEGGVSPYHLKHGGDLVWNVGTGYFGCRDEAGNFSPEKFKETAALPNVKMIELKLSQGAKPGHGGLLPSDKITEVIAETRGIPMGQDCDSPAVHGAFDGAEGLVEFIAQLRELSGGKPIGIKMCVGRFDEVASIIYAMKKLQTTPDFITIDGSEGGTGAAPPEFSNFVGTPLVEALHFVETLLVGAGLRNRVRLIASGKILSAFSVVKTLAIGADICNSARAFMFALGCIQALKCNTNKCPTGVATQDKRLMQGLDVGEKALRVFRFHQRTMQAAMELVGCIGLDDPSLLSPDLIMRKTAPNLVESYAEMYPAVEPGALLTGKAPPHLQHIWDRGKAHLNASSAQTRQQT